jgi:hypothetical protein
LFLRKALGTLSLVAGLCLTGCGGSGSGGGGNTNPVAPTITWATPAAITVGTSLSATQLDATASIPGTTTSLPGTYVYTPPAGTVESAAGTITLSVTFTPTDTTTYTSATATVSLTVNPAPKVTPVVTWAMPAPIAAGTALSSTQLDATAAASSGSSALPGTFAYTPAIGTVENTVGTVALSVTFTPTDTTDYTTATATVNLTVNAALITPVITWPTPGAITVGTALNSIQLDATAAAPGSNTALAGAFVYTPPSGTVENTVGNQTLSVTFTPTDTTDYATATATVTLAVNAAIAPSYTFNPVRIIGGGYVDGIVMHPGQKGLMYARTDVGGAYRWDATNSIWIPLTDWITRANSNYIGIESIGIDPNDPQRLYLAVGMYTESFGSNGAMLVSDDQGATFTTVALPFKNGSNDDGRNAGERLSVDPNLGTTVLFGSRQNGLWKSADHGMTWNQVTTFPVTSSTSGVGIVFEIFIPASSTSGTATKTIYAAVSATGTGTDPQSLYVSNDAGATWTAVPGAPTGLYISRGALGPDGNLYFSMGDQPGPYSLTTGKVMQYVPPTPTNPTGTWNDITPPRASGYQGGYGGLTLDPEKPGTIMVATLDHYYPIGDDLWRSLDYGKTWYSINTVGANRDDSLSPYLLFGAASTAGTGTGNWVGSLQIDPFNSRHVVYGTGATVETTADMTASDNQTAPSNWTVGALGIEETVITGLISPPSGPANLLSVMGDIDGFEHTDLTVSPASGMFQNPSESTGTSIDFAQSTPAFIVRVGNGNGNKQFGGYSTNSGAAWTPFPTNPAGTKNGSGSIAVSADSKTLVWSPGDTGVATSYSTNNGATWTASTGAPANLTVLSDRINPKTFYIYDGNHGVLYTSTDGGVTFASTLTGLPQYGTLNVAYDAEGSLWLVSYQGLYHATKGATTFTQVTGVQSGYSIVEGMPLPGSNILTLYLGGTVNSVPGIFRSTDNGSTWIRVDDAAHQYGYIEMLQGDPRVFGRVYLGTGGRGIIHADSPN